jgi:hypothetical protein
MSSFDLFGAPLRSESVRGQPIATPKKSKPLFNPPTATVNALAYFERFPVRAGLVTKEKNGAWLWFGRAVNIGK